MSRKHIQNSSKPSHLLQKLSSISSKEIPTDLVSIHQVFDLQTALKRRLRVKTTCSDILSLSPLLSSHSSLNPYREHQTRGRRVTARTARAAGRQEGRCRQTGEREKAWSSGLGGRSPIGVLPV
ncbi:hypothetical protein E3N88_13433 [Mikania micrantha]|uniref:Uncharacterized protein n=1 Tax=Mikania micrantha TaxID=192012 RepID=A0A5N6PAB6_9ASTR|nr:hypothetical protein E3N88_13433 [Mikania micrantha]